MHIKGTPWSPEDKEALRQAYQAGQSKRELADEIGVSVREIYRQLEDIQSPRRSQAETQQLVLELLEQGLSDEDIRDRIEGVNSSLYVGKLRRAAGIKYPQGVYASWHYIKSRASDVQKARTLEKAS